MNLNGNPEAVPSRSYVPVLTFRRGTTCVVTVVSSSPLFAMTHFRGKSYLCSDFRAAGIGATEQCPFCERGVGRLAYSFAAVRVNGSPFLLKLPFQPSHPVELVFGAQLDVRRHRKGDGYSLQRMLVEPEGFPSVPGVRLLSLVGRLFGCVGRSFETDDPEELVREVAFNAHANALEAFAEE